MSSSKKSFSQSKGLEELDFSEFNNKNQDEKDACEVHPDKIVTNFCSNLECLKPLCDECILQHALTHNNNDSDKSARELETLDSVRDKCARKIKAALAMISSEIESSEKLFVFDEEGLIKEGKIQLDNAKSRLLRFIENYFVELEEIYKRHVLENKLKTDDIRDLITKMKKVTEALNGVHYQLDQKKEIGGLSKMLRRICLLDLRSVKQSMSSKIQKMIELRDIETYELLVDHDYVFRIRETLEKYISLANSKKHEPGYSGKRMNFGQGARKEKKKELPLTLHSPKDKRPIIFENVENFKRNLLSNKNDIKNQLNFSEMGSLIDITMPNEKKEFYDYGQKNKAVTSSSKKAPKTSAFPEFDDFCSISLQQLAVEALPNFPQSGIKLPSGGKEISKAGMVAKTVNFDKSLTEIESGFDRQGFQKAQSYTGSMASSTHSNMMKGPASNSNKKRSPISITADDYFLKYAPRKFLHFFQNEGNILKTLDFQSLIYRVNKEYETSHLNIDFNLPKFHKSIALPSGELYLIGGSDPFNSMEKSDAIYKYKFEKNSLDLVGNLKYPRSSHAICYHHPFIVVVGGLTTGLKVLSVCEKINIENNEVTKMGTLNEPTASACVASFSQKYLFKFGGIADGQNLSQSIERFDFISKKWEIIDPKISLGIDVDFKLLSASACLQINEKDIMVFGGYDDSNRGSNQSFIFSVENFAVKGESFTIKKINHYCLPYAEGFWNSQAVIHQKKLYTLQNIENPSNDDCLEDSRSTLVFDGTLWDGF